jgi:hypothetical protein
MSTVNTLHCQNRKAGERPNQESLFWDWSQMTIKDNLLSQLQDNLAAQYEAI